MPTGSNGCSTGRDRGCDQPGLSRPRRAPSPSGGGVEWEGLPVVDPRPAILAFHRQLAARGITLILVPTPVKPAIHPVKLVSRYPDQRGPVVNPSYAAFVEGFAREGIQLFDPADALSVARRTERSPRHRYALAPEAMELRRSARRLHLPQTPLADVP